MTVAIVASFWLAQFTAAVVGYFLRVAIKFIEAMLSIREGRPLSN